MRNAKMFIVSLGILYLGCNTEVMIMPNNIDHLVYTSPTLQEGMDEIESLLGIRPVLGGRHPNYGTQNALLSLGDSTYLEIIAPDPDQARPEAGRLFEESYSRKPRLTTWVLRADNIGNLHSNAVKNGLELGVIESGKREKADGTILSWTLTDPHAMPFSGAIPFLIHWGETPHPAGSLPRAGDLLGMVIEHPNPDAVAEGLGHLGVTLEVRKAESFRLFARIRTENNGVVILK